jgi:threonine 3-dehydrogenase
MKALIKSQSKPGLWLGEVPVPEFGANDVLIRVKKTSICGTDVHIYDWDEWAQKTIAVPTVIGHEFCGVVEKIGANVSNCRVGDLVSGEGHIVCGHCRACQTERKHLCENTLGLGVQRDGAFAQFVSLPSSNVWRAESNFPADLLSIFDPLGNAVHAATSVDLLGKDVLIAGAGPIGLMAVCIAKKAGAKTIAVTDFSAYRLTLAKKLGATQTIFANDTVDGLFDVGFEMSGSPNALDTLIKKMRKGAKIILVGILPENTKLNGPEVIFGALEFKAIYGRKIFETWHQVQNLIDLGVDFRPIITHSFKAADFEKAFSLLKKGECAKIILDWE